MRELTLNDQIDRRQKVFCNLTTDDIAHDCKNENSLLIRFSPLKQFDNL
jgi:hypothetical protein